MIDASQVLKHTPACIRLLSDCVLVRLRSRYDDYTGPLAMPDECWRADPNEGARGTVVSVGPGYCPERRLAPHRTPQDECPPGSRRPQTTELSPLRWGQLIPMTVKPGDEVLLDSALAGDAIVLDNREHRIVRESEIACILEEFEEFELVEHDCPPTERNDGSLGN